MTRTLTALLLLALSAAITGCARGRPAEPVTGPSFSVLTFNVNFGGPGMADTVAAITDADADVVCLQETTPAWEAAVRAAVGGRYPHVAFRHDAGGAGGMGLLSKFPVRDGGGAAFVRPAAGWFPACVATVDTPAGPVQVVSVHLRPPVSDGGSFVSGYFSTPAVRRAEIEQVDAAAADLAPQGPGGSGAIPRLYVGDFNEADDGRAITWLRTQGYRTPLSDFDPRTSTWRWQYGVLPLRGRLDHVAHTPDLHCFDCRVLRRGGSDHFPILARLGRPTTTTPHDDARQRRRTGSVAMARP